MAKLVLSAAIAILCAWGARGDETPLSKSCIFAAAAQLPPVPGMVIKSASTTQSSQIPVATGDPSLRQWTVSLVVEAAGQTAAYEALCKAGNKTPASVIQMTIRDLPAASAGPSQPACSADCKPSGPELPKKK